VTETCLQLYVLYNGLWNLQARLKTAAAYILHVIY